MDVTSKFDVYQVPTVQSVHFTRCQNTEVCMSSLLNSPITRVMIFFVSLCPGCSKCLCVLDVLCGHFMYVCKSSVKKIYFPTAMVFF